MKHDDSCVMQVYKDIPSTLTCVSCSVFWLDDKMTDHSLRRGPIARGVLSRRYRLRTIDEVSRLARPNAKVVALEW
jgi:hypothetical protein